MSEILLTLDAGTTGLKAAAFDLQGRLCHSVVEPYVTRYPGPGWAEQDPEDQVRAAVRAVRRILERVSGEEIVALGLSGTMNGCIAVDGSGYALHPNIIHSDTRTGRQVAWMEERLSGEQFYAVTGNRIDTHYGLPKMLWIEQERPEIYEKTRWFLNIKDYLYGRLTGRMGWTDYSDASLTAAFDIGRRRWAEEILGELGLGCGRMPEVTHASDTSGRLTQAMARATGLPEGLPVAMGGGDGACAAQGAGAMAAGDAHINIGSSAWISVLTQSPVQDDGRRIFQYVGVDPRLYVVCGTVQCGAAAFQWAADHLLGGEGYGDLERLAEQAPPGADGLFYLPTLMGERTPWWTSKASGALIGFTLRHGRAHVARAVYEGVSQALNLCASILQSLGLPSGETMLIGGGARSRLWPKMLAAMLDRPIAVHAAEKEATSLGAAISAGVGVGVFRDEAQAKRMIRQDRRELPDPAWRDAYARHFTVYQNLYPKMQAAYSDIHAYQQERVFTGREQGS